MYVEYVYICICTHDLQFNECIHFENMLVQLTKMALGLPMTHRLIFLSSPPVASIRPLLGLRETQFTVEPWATNSPVEKN